MASTVAIRDNETDMSKKQAIAVWFSCGAASAVAAKKTIEWYGDTHIVRVINSPVIEEDEDNKRFLLDVQDWLGVEVETAINSKFPECSADRVWRKRKYMSGVKGAPCTSELKKKARQQWEKGNPVDWHVLGFTADKKEKARHKRFIITERDNVLPVLIDAGLTKADCFNVLIEAGIEPPRMYAWGYPNANCIGCVKSESPTYWNLVRKVHPEVFKARAELSRELKVRLVEYKGERIFLDELDENATGGKIRSFECGVFCEEHQLQLFHGNGS